MVVHCASNVQNPDDDARALNHLVTASQAHAFHLVYVSICGIEKAAEVLDYYKVKLRNEEVLRKQNVAHTIVRISQFHPFVAMVLSHLVKGPVMLVPRFSLQPVDLDYAALQLATYAVSPVPGRAPDVHGPELIASNVLASSWRKSRGLSRLALPFPRVGLLKALGALSPVKGHPGGRSWNEWLDETTRSENPYGEG